MGFDSSLWPYFKLIIPPYILSLNIATFRSGSIKVSLCEFYNFTPYTLVIKHPPSQAFHNLTLTLSLQLCIRVGSLSYHTLSPISCLAFARAYAPAPHCLSHFLLISMPHVLWSTCLAGTLLPCTKAVRCTSLMLLGKAVFLLIPSRCVSLCNDQRTQSYSLGIHHCVCEEGP